MTRVRTHRCSRAPGRGTFAQGTAGMQGALPFQQNVEHAHARGRDHRHSSRKDKPHRAPTSSKRLPPLLPSRVCTVARGT